MIWSRATQEEYEAWKSLSGSDQWSWDTIKQYMIKSFTVYPDQRDVPHGVTTEAYNPEYEGFSGPVSVSHNTLQLQ